MSHDRQVSHDGRFAPSPTGPLHLGSLRTALVAWLLARSAGARFMLRIEDLDPDRCRSELAAAQIDDLRRLGIDWDGPVLWQSQRGDAYAAAIDALRAAGRLYPCFCTRAEIRAAASAPHGDGAAAASDGGAAADGEAAADGAPAPGGEPLSSAYPGTCRRLDPDTVARRLAAGERHALRFDGRGERGSFVDRFAGPQTFAVDDFVVQRTDGVVAYQLAVVVDDAWQGIGEVVRGADLLDSTPRQSALARALGLAIPAYAHVPLVLGPDGARLAKRFGSVRPEDARDTLPWLARSLGIDPAGVRTAGDLLPRFAPERISTEPVTSPSADRCTAQPGDGPTAPT